MGASQNTLLEDQTSHSCPTISLKFDVTSGRGIDAAIQTREGEDNERFVANGAEDF